MTETVFPAIIFTVENELPEAQLKELMSEIKLKTSGWYGEPHYKGVLAFPCFGRRGNVPLDVMLPYDRDGLKDVLLSIPELKRVRASEAYDLMAVFDRSLKPKRRVKKAEKSAVDLKETRFGFDENKIDPKFRFLLEDDAHREDAAFAKLLDGYPYTDKSPARNQRYIDYNVIAILRSEFPLIYDANLLLNGEIVRALRAIADPKNQERLPQHWHQALARMFERGRHPGSLDVACRFVTGHFAKLDLIAKKGVEKPQGIARRYGEQIIDAIDPITAHAVSLG